MASSEPVPIPESLHFLKTGGDYWEIWDGSTALYNDVGYQCRWTQYRISSKSDKSVRMCLNPPREDSISQNILDESGVNPECYSVMRNFNFDTMISSSSTSSTTIYTYLEIGAHIGSCAVAVLMAFPQNVHVVVFEPHPRNLFSLTQTILANPSWKDRIQIYPVALGDRPGRVAFNFTSSPTTRRSSTASVNDTSAVRLTYTPPQQPQQQNGYIPVEVLDNVLVTSARTRITLMHIHVNGYECAVLDGAKHTMDEYTEAILFRFIPNELKENRCSSSLISSRLKEIGMVARWERSYHAQGDDSAITIIARRTNALDPVPESNPNGLTFNLGGLKPPKEEEEEAAASFS